MLSIRFVINGEEVRAQDVTVKYSPEHQRFSYQNLNVDVYLNNSVESFTTNGLVTLKDDIVFISPAPQTES